MCDTPLMPEISSLNTPLQVDTQLAALSVRRRELENRRSQCVNTALHMAGAKFYYQGRRRVTDMIEETAIGVLNANPDFRDLSYGRTNAEAVAAIEAVDADLAILDNEIFALEAKYTGWTRFFLVTSSVGHIHRHTACSTCRPTTTFGWLPHLSGHTEADAVEACGPALCTVCFPSAPTAHTMAKLTKKQAEDILAGRKVEAAPAKEYCPGSGTRSATEINWRRMSPSGKCSHCGYVGAVTQNGTMRKHQAKVAS